jgi:hypothetical protein
VNGTDQEEEEEEEEEEVSSSSPKQIMHPTYTLEHAPLRLKYAIIEHVFMNSIQLDKNSSPR